MPTPKIIDFDLSIKLEEWQRSIKETSFIGTNGYIAPELSNLNRGLMPINNMMYTYNEAVDVYAFGVSLYATLLYEYPYSDNEKTNRWKKFFIDDAMIDCLLVVLEGTL